MENLEFARRFKEACEASNAPSGQDQLGKYLGVSGAMVSYLRNGARLPSAKTGIKIASKLKISYDWLMLGVSEIKQTPSDLDKRAVNFALRVLDAIPNKIKNSLDMDARASIFAKAYKLSVLDDSADDPISIQSFIELVV